MIDEPLVIVGNTNKKFLLYILNLSLKKRLIFRSNKNIQNYKIKRTAYNYDMAQIPEKPNQFNGLIHLVCLDSKTLSLTNIFETDIFKF